MKIACPTKNGQIDNHFGHCEYFTVFTIEANQVTDEARFDSPVGCGCKSSIAGDLEKAGVKVMLAGNMGEGALNVLKSHNIEVIRGCQGEVRAVLEAYLEGELKDTVIACDHHDCNHH